MTRTNGVRRTGMKEGQVESRGQASTSPRCQRLALHWDVRREEFQPPSAPQQ